jgi:hypothetical protein
VNKFRFSLSEVDKQINVPVKLDFDFTGQGDLISIFENDIIEQVINPIRNFETIKFAHKSVENDSSINYKFYFFDYSTNIQNTTFSNENLWTNSYNSTSNPDFTGQTFTDKEIYYTANSFRRSFFKLDFYDSKNTSDQKNYFTVILPTQQGKTIERNIGTDLLPQNVQVKIPNMSLDYIGDKEGFFIYFTEDINTIDIDTFYMSVKFFNAKIGEFVRFINKPQSSISTKFNFKKENNFYYKLIFDYQDKKYSIFNEDDQIIGTVENPINWYEYINP